MGTGIILILLLCGIVGGISVIFGDAENQRRKRRNRFKQ